MADASRFYEDIELGESHEAGAITLTREAIVAFAQMYDPQPFHLDEEAGRASLLGGIAASGWQTASVGMRLLYEAFIKSVACIGSPGIEDLRWLKPVRPGAALFARVSVVGKRLSASRPDRGFFALALSVLDAAGDAVMTQRFTIIVLRAGAVHAAGTPPVPVAAETTAQPTADAMLTATYDEVTIGHATTFGTQLFTADLITGFARTYDPQSFHLDATAAAATHFGGLSASGWQTAAFWMRHYVAARTRSSDVRRSAGLPVMVGGPSPGFTDMKWLRPIRAGESVTYGLTILAKRKSGRSGWAMIVTDNTGTLRDGTVAFRFKGRLLWPTASG